MSAAKKAEPKPDRWEESAKRQNERLAARDPLFAHAGLVPQTTAEEQRRKVEGNWARFEAEKAASDAAGHAEGERRRAWVAARIHPDELAELDRRRSWCPPDGAYSADFWGGEIKKRDDAAWLALQTPEHRESILMLRRIEAEIAERNAAPKPEQVALPAPPRERIAAPTRIRIGDDHEVEAEREHAAEEEAAPLPAAIVPGK